MSADTLVLKSIDDPRDSLDKARRKELERFARENGVREVVHGMPAIVMRRILRGKGLTDISIPKRTLGFPEPGTAPPGHAAPVTNEGLAIADVAQAGGDAVNAEDDLMRQWAAQTSKPVEEMSIAELRKTCTERGIPMARTDNTETLKAKLHDKDAPERGQ